eukprot:jgi/Astpho2/5291/e_gw1.00074.33.1_t
MSRPEFFYGVACSSYQIEGAWQEDGKSKSIWDTFSHTPGKVHNGDTGDVATDFYHNYKKDIAMMKEMGIQAFRMSLSWPRILPNGTGAVNQKGLDFYSAVLDELEAAGIEPWVTLYHWDLPQALHDAYGGWLDEQSIADFAEYAEVVFKAMGHRVTNWSTFNEPWTFVELGYHLGVHAPGHVHPSDHWRVGHHVLLAHAAAVQHFRRLVPHGRISLNANTDYAEPLTDSQEDKDAAERRLEFMCARFSDPIFLGERDYPKSLKQRVPWLPEFTAQQSAALKDSADLFLINNYRSTQTPHMLEGDMELFGLDDTVESFERDGQPIGPRAASDWLYSVPWGLRKLLVWLHKRYGGPDIVVTENGCDGPGEDAAPLPDVLDDKFRQAYYREYLAQISRAVKEHGVRVKGYFAWSLLDNFEWAEGYSKRFGIVYVDYKTQQRYPKQSSKLLQKTFASVSS